MKDIGLDYVTFEGYMKNSQRWLSECIINRIVSENIKNIKELNRIIEHFGRRLYEYEQILKYDYRTMSAENPNVKNDNIGVTIDDLMMYQSNVKRGGAIWQLTHNVKNPEDVYQDFEKHIRIQLELEQYLSISGFRTVDTRYIIFKMIDF